MSATGNVFTVIGSCRATGNVRAGQEEMCYFQLFVDLHVGLVCVGLHATCIGLCRATCRATGNV